VNSLVAAPSPDIREPELYSERSDRWLIVLARRIERFQGYHVGSFVVRQFPGLGMNAIPPAGMNLPLLSGGGTKTRCPTTYGVQR